MKYEVREQKGWTIYYKSMDQNSSSEWLILITILYTQSLTYGLIFLKRFMKNVSNLLKITLVTYSLHDINSFRIVSNGLKQWLWYSHALILTTHFSVKCEFVPILYGCVTFVLTKRF